MDIGRPYSDVIPGARGRLFATLAQLEVPVTVRALARHAGISPQTALNLVDDLSGTGIVQVERVGGMMLVQLNRDHILAEPIEALVRSRGRLIQRLRDHLEAWPLLAAAWMFGSAARGDGDRNSDIDLLLVAEASTEDSDWIDAVGALADQLQAWTGNEIQIVEYSWEAFVRLVHEDNLLVAALRSEGIALTARSRERLRDAA